MGKKDVIDPLTGKVTKAQLGSASRLENIFRTNLQSAYAVGQWQSIEANKETAPFLMYDAVEDHRTRPEHQQWNGTTREVDDPFWQTHYPTNGWQCRCGVIQMSREEMDTYRIKPSPKPKVKTRKWTNPRTGKTRTIAADLDPGWDLVKPEYRASLHGLMDHNPGQRRMKYLRELKKKKAGKLSIAQQQANGVSDKAIAKAQKKFMTELAANQALKKLGKAEVDGAFDRQKKKTLQRAAQHQLDTAISQNTPYLANAIKQLGKQKGNATLKPTELLEKAKSKATSIEQSVLLNQYQILTKLEQAGEAEKLSPTQLLKQVEEQYKVEQLKKETAAKLSGYKKKVLDGKLPTPGQQAAFNTLDDEAKEKFLAKVDAAKQKNAVPVAAPKPKEKAIKAPASKQVEKGETADPGTVLYNKQLHKLAETKAYYIDQYTNQYIETGKKDPSLGKYADKTPEQKKLVDEWAEKARLKHKYNKSVGFAEDFNLEGKKSKSLKLLKGWLKENPEELKEKWIKAAKGTKESQTRDYKLTLVKRDDLVESQLGEGFINFDSLNTAEEIQKAKTYSTARATEKKPGRSSRAT